VGNIKLIDLKTSQIQEFLNKKSKSGRADGKEGGLSYKSIKNMRAMLRLALNKAIDDNKLLKNPVIDTVLTKNENDNKEMTVLSKSEQEALIKACRDSENITAFGIILCVYTGLRIGELMGLTWDSVDLDKKVITIRQSVGRKRNLEEGAKNKTIL